MNQTLSELPKVRVVTAPIQMAIPKTFSILKIKTYEKKILKIMNQTYNKISISRSSSTKLTKKRKKMH